MEDKNKLVKDHLYKKFYEGLYEKYNITKEQFNEYNFKKLAESNKNGKLSKDTYLRNSSVELLELIPLMKRVDECVCKVKILYNCFIYSETQDIMLVIGSCCNKNYTKNKNKRFCSKCGVEHKNRIKKKIDGKTYNGYEGVRKINNFNHEEEENKKLDI